MVRLYADRMPNQITWHTLNIYIVPILTSHSFDIRRVPIALVTSPTVYMDSPVKTTKEELIQQSSHFMLDTGDILSAGVNKYSSVRKPPLLEFE